MGCMTLCVDECVLFETYREGMRGRRFQRNGTLNRWCFSGRESPDEAVSVCCGPRRAGNAEVEELSQVADRGHRIGLAQALRRAWAQVCSPALLLWSKG